MLTRSAPAKAVATASASRPAEMLLAVSIIVTGVVLFSALPFQLTPTARVEASVVRLRVLLTI